MKNLTIPMILMLTLSGCAREEPVSQTISENAINATTALEQSLTVECKTDSIKTQLTVIKTEIMAVNKACQTEKEQITREKNSWKLGFWGLIIIMGAYIIRKILK